MLLRFVWGRSRLPREGAWQRKFELSKRSTSSGQNPDDNWPLAHTCFFKVDLPEYSSAEVMREKLRLAIRNCGAIDDDDVVDRTAWGDDDSGDAF